MDIKEINKRIDKIIKETGFKAGKEIYRAVENSKDNLRNIIYSGVYKKEPAVLKFYDDPRFTDEPISLSAFSKNNQSNILFAPAVYKKEIISAHTGWFIGELIPGEYKKYKTPLNKKEREEFLRIFLEYRKYFPKRPTRKLFLAEKLSAENYHIMRINRWFEMAQKKEADSQVGNKKLFLSEEFLNLYEKAIREIRKEFKNRKMIWCHGHFKHHEIFTDRKRSKYYLIDFAHTAMFPEGYELAFIVWADYFMVSEKWNLPFSKWKKAVDGWIVDIENLAGELKFKNPKRLIRASIIERILGTILADITASDRSNNEKTKGINLMTRLLGELL